MSVADEIEKLSKLKQTGAMTEEEYQRAKENLLKQLEVTVKRPLDVNRWSMFVHLSQLCGIMWPMAGWVVPIILWQIKKDESEIIDKHGKIVANWLLTTLIAGIVCILLVFILIGIPLLIALVVLNIVFPIIGAAKANDGKIWPYPMSIKFFKLE